MNLSADNKSTLINVAIYAGVAIILFFLVKKVIASINIFGDFGEKADDATQAMIEAGAVPTMAVMNTKLISAISKQENTPILKLSPTRLLAAAQYQSIKSGLADDCGQMYNAKGVLQDSHETVFAILRKYDTIYKLSQLFDAFALLTTQYLGESKDLTSYLWTFMDNAQMKTVSGIINIKKRPDFLLKDGKIFY